MPKSAPINAEPSDNRAISRGIGEHTAEAAVDRAPRVLLAVFFAIAFGGMLIWGINKEIAQIDFCLLVSAPRATPASSLAAALAATALSYLALVGYDMSGLRYARARVALKTILLASFCGFALGNCVGLGAFSGGAVRYRLYTAAGLSPGQIARAILFISIAFGVGLGVIAALGLLLDAKEVSGLLGASPAPLRAGAAIVLALAVGFMAFCALRRTPWRRGPIEIDAPDTKLVLTQLLFTTIDVSAAAAALWVLLPSVGISFFSFAAIYAAALALGVLSHIPGGAQSTFCSPCSSRPFSWPTSNCSARSTRQWVDGSSRLAPHFLAATTFMVGAILVMSGAMPAFIDRLQILQVAVPLWAVEVSHFLTSVAGLILLFAAYGLHRRLDGAWWLALGMTLLSIPLSLIKGLALVAPSVSIILLIGLLGVFELAILYTVGRPRR
jgi:phosphatidylglycerol lysyltransferase